MSDEALECGIIEGFDGAENLFPSLHSVPIDVVDAGRLMQE